MHATLSRSDLTKLRDSRAGRNVAVGLVSVAAMMVVFLSAAMLCTLTGSGDAANTGASHLNPIAHTESVFSVPMVVNAEGFCVIGFEVPVQAQNATLHGYFTASGNGTNNCVTVVVLSQQDFVNWLSNGECRACYNQDLMPATAGGIDVALPNGVYYIYFSSASYREAKTVSGQIDLTYQS